MYTLFVSLIIIASILMVFIVLIQESKGGGLSSNFSSSNQFMGVRKTTDIVEKATWGLAIAMVVFSVASSYVAPQAASFNDEALKPTMTNSANIPGFEGNAQGAPAANTKAPAAKAEAPAAANTPAPAEKPAK